MLQYITENLNLVLMLVFILFYSLLVLLNNNKSVWADFFRNIVYMGSGMIFVIYIIQI